MNGLFVGAMTSCSLAIQKDIEKILPMINIVYRDELSTDNREQMILFIAKCCEFIKFKMLSLSNNKNLIDSNVSFGRE